MGYFSYRLALAKTALVIESDYRNKADIEEALTCCQRAFDLVTFQSYADDLKRCYVQLCENPQNPIDLKTHRLVKHVFKHRRDRFRTDTKLNLSFKMPCSVKRTGHFSFVRSKFRMRRS